MSDRSPTPAALKWAPRLIELAAIVALGLLLARLVWLVLAPGGAVSAVTERPQLNAVQPVATVSAPIDRSVLVRRNAFASAEIEDAEPLVDEAPETTLNLVLRGLRSASGGGTSAATIVTPDNRQAVYQPGDEILDGVVLSRVLSDRVILDKGGTFESLFLEGRTGELNVIGGEEPRQEIGGQSVVEPSVTRVGSFETLMRAVRIERSMSPQGWRFRSAGNPDVMAAAGLQDGDFIVSVAGMDASDLEYEDVADAIGDTGRVDLTIRRGTQMRRLTLVFEE